MKTWLSTWMTRLHRDQRGLETMEYLLVAAFVLGASVATYSALSLNVQTASTNMADDVHTALNGGGSGSGGSTTTSTTTDPGGGIDAGDLGDPTGGVDPTGGIDPIGGIDPTGGTDPVGGVDPKGGVDPIGGTNGTDFGDPIDLGDSVNLGNLVYPDLPANHPLNNGSFDPVDYTGTHTGGNSSGNGGNNNDSDGGKPSLWDRITGVFSGGGSNNNSDDDGEKESWWDKIKSVYWDGWKKYIEKRPRKEWLKLLTDPNKWHTIFDRLGDMESWFNGKVWTKFDDIRAWLGGKGFFRFLDKIKGPIRKFCDFLSIAELSMMLGELWAAWKSGDMERMHYAGEDLFNFVYKEVLFGKLEKIGGGAGMKWVKDWLPPLYFVMTEVLEPLTSMAWDGLNMLALWGSELLWNNYEFFRWGETPDNWEEFLGLDALENMPDYYTDSLGSWHDDLSNWVWDNWHKHVLGQDPWGNPLPKKGFAEPAPADPWSGN